MAWVFAVLLVLLLLLLPRSVRAAEQTLYILLDGVPYQLMRELGEEGRLPGWGIPSRLITTFPSTTISGFTGIFKSAGAESPQGYDNQHFSYVDNRIKGAMIHHILEPGERTYETFLDYQRFSAWEKMFMYMAPGVSVQGDLIRMRKVLNRSTADRNIIIYFGGTDGSAHVLGEKRLKRLVAHILDFVVKTAQNYERRVGHALPIVVLSDHGFHFSPLKGVTNGRLRKHFRAHGFEMTDQLRDARSVVSIPWGNISGSGFYTRPANAPEMAAVLSKVPGIDLTFYAGNGFVSILSRKRGMAQVDFDADGNRFRYTVLTGDPLDYVPVLAELKRRGLTDAAGYAADRDWFQLTNAHQYPDALHRLYVAFNGLVKNPATILVSTEPNYEIGSSLTRFLSHLRGGLKGTHGGLFYTSSDAFIMTNQPEAKLPMVMRFSDVLPALSRARLLPSPNPSKFQSVK